jgi:hypothetical protein
MALFLHLAPPPVSQAFKALAGTTDTAPIEVSDFAQGLQPARHAHVDGVYLRYVETTTAKKHGVDANFGPYIGISVDVGKRQKGHDCYAPVNRLMAEAVSHVPAGEWKAVLVWNAGPSGLSELPKPVACMIESIIIGKVSLITYDLPG